MMIILTLHSLFLHDAPFKSLITMLSNTTMFNPDQLSELFPKAILSKIPDRLLTVQDPSIYSNDTARHNALLGQIALEACLEWIKSYELDETASAFSENLPSIWEVIDGCLVRLDKTCIAVIPTESFEEIAVPAEWIDIPTWSADYYIPVHIDLETQQVCLWGYTTHQYIKENVVCDPIYRNYYIDCIELVNSLDTLWTARELGLNERITVSYQAEAITPQLIEQLSQPSLYSPRLEVSFNQWASLIENDETRQQLYQQRLARAMPVANVSQTIAQSVTNLSEWLNRNFDRALESGWQTLSDLLAPASYGFVRSGPTEKTIQLAKLVDLQLQLDSLTVILSLAITPTDEETCSILAQVYPQTADIPLPSDLTIALLDGDTCLQSVTSRDDDDYIQLRTFHCTAGTDFTLSVERDGISVKEAFTIDSFLPTL
jgi:hypothetical protein